MTARYKLHVSSRALPGREEDYDRWYAETHVADMLALPGFLACDRYRQLGMDGQPTGIFVALYEVETDDPAALLQSVFAAVPTMRLTDAIDPDSAAFSFLQ
ncbi:hypothetical protein GG804_05530 [Sphingomonas histidinilytica]|uniref:DUF4286 family protein n=1 Tax=Rhizorhabdus histidinilytica TaxID=439228 RepID=UPI001ADA43FC|nr:DUF4286 family protein [Rhizorhabdus histidinilytica]MBO9376219.1 hypothetical protein [Rhizorhabdus histidinilytica]